MKRLEWILTIIMIITFIIILWLFMLGYHKIKADINKLEISCPKCLQCPQCEPVNIDDILYQIEKSCENDNTDGADYATTHEKVKPPKKISKKVKKNIYKQKTVYKQKKERVKKKSYNSGVGRLTIKKAKKIKPMPKPVEPKHESVFDFIFTPAIDLSDKKIDAPAIKKVPMVVKPVPTPKLIQPAIKPIEDGFMDYLEKEVELLEGRTKALKGRIEILEDDIQKE